ncbi:ATP-binding protein [Kitasatospora sp. NPDC048540]|uniref:ATP-binding protein n=1 Tax=unclassified Kitasatospora TaxID=2633591 RepID=UPI00068D337C|nr:ATP-binding protein [Kitasatospora sp. MBT63]
MTTTASTTTPVTARAPVQQRTPPSSRSARKACGQYWEAAFSASPESVADIRGAARAFFEQVRPGHPREEEDLLLVVSELVTNAVRHTHGPGTITVTALDEELDIAVSDTSRTPPLPRLPDPQAGTGGLGLHLVAALCGILQVTLDPGSGKTVHAHLPCRRRHINATGHRPAPEPAAFDPRARAW